MSGFRGVFIITLKVDCMHIARLLKHFQNVTAQNLSIVFTKFCAQLYIRDGEPLTRWSLSDPLVVSKTVEKNANEHLRNEEKFICLCCGVEDLLFAVHTQ